MHLRQILYAFSCLLIGFLSALISACKEHPEIDLLIKNGTVYNGLTASPSFVDIAIKGDKIVWIGDKITDKIIAKKTIDASGLIVSPGFIDPHTHADKDLLKEETSHNLPFLMQGVTTVTVGNDGNSIFPINAYKDNCMKNGIGTNVVMLVGHGTIRKHVVGESDRPPSAKELSKMKELLRTEMLNGARGISTGLFYKPGSYSKTKEVIELAKTIAQMGGIYDTHLRDESTFSIGLIPAVKEAIEIGEEAKIPVHISHIKCLGVDVWKQSDSLIQLIEEARNTGLDITANQYPYEASATSLQAAVIPRWAESGGKDSLFIRYGKTRFTARILKDTQNNIARRGGPDKLLIVQAEDSSLVGKTLLKISEELRLSPQEAVFEILESNSPKVASFNMNSYDISNFIKQPWVVTGSDGGSGHPRKYGSFPRKYQKYVVADSILPFSEFINGSTGRTAEILKLPKRGKLIEGYYADIIIFNPGSFKDIADYTHPFEYSEGIEYSLINGKFAIENGKFTGALNGRILDK